MEDQKMLFVVQQGWLSLNLLSFTYRPRLLMYPCKALLPTQLMQ